MSLIYVTYSFDRHMGLGVIDPVAKPPNEYILMNTITCAVFKLYLKY